MEKLDFRTKHKELYNPSKKEVSIVEVPAFNFLMMDGTGDPNNNPRMQLAFDALFSVSYTLKFMFKRGKHHEIYLSDFWRVKPEKLKTIIRQPCGKA
ncbi:MAG: small molecule-binding protein [Euryarchaeota archaeon]|nr:small molecule-binding protein [Euryarchaeota archaeon]